MKKVVSVMTCALSVMLTAGEGNFWDKEELNQVPICSATAEYPEFERDDMKSLFYAAPDYDNHKVKVWAYYSTPEGEMPENGWPAVVLVPGYGCTARPESIKAWNQHGYAAISMDLSGSLPEIAYPRPHQPWGGPSEKHYEFCPVEQHWFYHATAQVRLAHNLLRSYPEIDSENIGIVGTSMGGMLTLISAATDSRYKFAVAVYGCGFIDESDSSVAFGSIFPGLTDEQRNFFKANWDPQNYLPHIAMPLLMVNDTNDGNFALVQWQKTLNLLPQNRRFGAIKPEIGHSFMGQMYPVNYAFADAIVKNSLPLPIITTPQIADGMVSAQLENGRQGTAELFYTVDRGGSYYRKWQKVAAQVNGQTIKAELPPDCAALFFTFYPEQVKKYDSTWGFSSEYIELPAK